MGMVVRQPKLQVYQFLTPEQAAVVQQQPVLTTAQLHLLKQQIEALRRINIQLKAAKHRQHTGQGSLPSQQVQPTPAHPLGGEIARKPASRKGKPSASSGRSAKRNRTVEKEEDSPSEVDTAAADEASEESEPELSDYETPEESEEEAAVAQVAAASLASPRRQTGRQRTGPQVLKDISSDDGRSDGEGEEDPEAVGGRRQQQQQQVRSDDGGGAKSTGSGRGGSSSKQQQRRASYVVVQDDTGGSGAGIVLPQMTPVPVEWSTGDDAVCSVCGDGDAAEGNLLLICEGRGCSVVVHQQCYGVAKVPKGRWLCDACADKLSPAAPNCACCPVVGGALRAVVSLGRVVPARHPLPGRVYVHVADALWVPEVTLADPDRMRGVQLDHMTALRAALRCGLCKQAGGAVVQCSFTNCCRPFHVMCARAAGQVLTFREMDGEPLAFCSVHSAGRYERSRDAICEGRQAEQAPDGSKADGEEQEGAAAMQDVREAGAGEEPVSEYELQRQRNIERNRQRLAELRQ
ncbi:hypothetical protein N2152v2_005821 [Parachlorella kessleri]